jgi:hypothetical protein
VMRQRPVVRVIRWLPSDKRGMAAGYVVCAVMPVVADAIVAAVDSMKLRSMKAGRVREAAVRAV